MRKRNDRRAATTSALDTSGKRSVKSAGRALPARTVGDAATAQTTSRRLSWGSNSCASCVGCLRDSGDTVQSVRVGAIRLLKEGPFDRSRDEEMDRRCDLRGPLEEMANREIRKPLLPGGNWRLLHKGNDPKKARGRARRGRSRQQGHRLRHVLSFERDPHGQEQTPKTSKEENSENAGVARETQTLTAFGGYVPIHEKDRGGDGTPWQRLGSNPSGTALPQIAG